MGSWIQLADGLPLRRYSETHNLKWASLIDAAPANHPKRLVFYQGTGGDDIEGFEVGEVSHMMAFDCGPFDLTAK